jgi:hypothetical protein
MGSIMDFRLTLAAMMLLAACGGSPWVEDDGSGNGGGDGDGGSDTSTAVPDAVKVNLRSIAYSPANGGTLKVNLQGLQSSPQSVAFQRDRSLDIQGYRAFTYQETGLQRKYLALVRENERGNLRVAAVADGGQFNRHFGGTTFARIDAYSRPNLSNGTEKGQFSYAGTYAGVFVPGDPANNTLPDDLRPNQTLRVRGDALINANFANDLVNGGVDNRWLLDSRGRRIDLNGDGTLNAEDQLNAIAFPSMQMNKSGRFVGDVEFSGDPNASIGKVAGLFGGRGATDVGGTLVINPIGGESDIWEYGAFTLPRCDTAGASPLCNPR